MTPTLPHIEPVYDAELPAQNGFNTPATNALMRNLRDLVEHIEDARREWLYATDEQKAIIADRLARALLR